MRRHGSFRSWFRSAIFCGVIGAGLVVPASSQVVDRARGVDPRVDYESLTRIGPWDDRNYRLTAEDVALLSKDEEEISSGPIPAFFRVEMRRKLPSIGKNKSIYPLNTFQIFLKLHGGYQIDGQLYRRIKKVDGRYQVLRGQVVQEEDWPAKALTGEVRMTAPNGDAESSIKINPQDSEIVVAGTNGPGTVQDMHFSTDGGATWTQAPALPTWEAPPGSTCCDPTVEWSSDGNFAYTATLGRCGNPLCDVWVYRSSDGGQNWDDFKTISGILNVRREVTSQQKSDKEYLHVDKAANSIYKDRVYLSWHDETHMKFSYSADFANTWSTPISISSGDDEKGVTSDMTTDPAGNVYYFWHSYASNQILMRRSLTGGAFWLGPITVANTSGSFTFPIPAADLRPTVIYPSADTDLTNGPYQGRIYVAWTDNTQFDMSSPALNHARIRVAYSSDQGSNWTVVTPHPTADFLTVDRFHQWLAVDAMGTVHLIYYDTTNSANRTGVDIYHTRSITGGATWTTPVRLTTVTSPHIEDGFQWGDYNGLDVVGNLAIGIFTDNRNENGGGADSKDVYGVAASTERSTIYISDGGLDGRILESTETSSVGGSAVSVDNSVSGLRVGDSSSDQQYRSILSFDTSDLPDAAKITEARLRLRRGTLVGSLAGLGTLKADVKTGTFGAAALAPSDFEAGVTVSTTCTLTIPSADGDFAECFLNTTGMNAINTTGLTQIRVNMTVGDNDDNSLDYMGFYGGEATSGFLQFLGPTLLLTYEPQ